MKPVSARLPVSSISRSRPTRSSISAHSAAGALVVPEDRRPEHAVVRVERDEAVHLAGQPDRGRLDAEIRERRLRRLPPVLGILLAPSRLRRRQRIAALRPRDDLAALGHGDRLDAGRADVEADERVHQAPSAAYTSSYAATASLRCCAARSAGSSIRAATPSMNRHCSTDRRTAATASSVYG